MLEHGLNFLLEHDRAHPSAKKPFSPDGQSPLPDE